jgi:septum formation protein
MSGEAGTGFPSDIASIQTAMTKIVLASASPSRRALLENAGIAFTARPAEIDERTVEAPLAASGAAPAEIAMTLAEAKALDVARGEPEAVVIGADQVLAAGARRWNKPATIAEARHQLMELSGHTHELHSAMAVARGRKLIWRHAEIARMTMHPLSVATIDAYLDSAGDAALSSVGAYQIEGPGIQLFERIEGDYFAILGLPLLPLLSFLRSEGVIG